MLRVMAEVALTIHTFLQPAQEICFAKNEKYSRKKLQICRYYPFLLLQYNDRITPLIASKEIYTRWKNMEGIRRLTKRRLTGSKRGGRNWLRLTKEC